MTFVLNYQSFNLISPQFRRFCVVKLVSIMNFRVHLFSFKYLLPFLFLLLHLDAFSQKSWKLDVNGNVKDEDTKEAMKGAKIEISKGGALYKTVYADGNGNFAFSLDPDNVYSIKVSIGNYVPKIITISTENTPNDEEVKSNFKAKTEFRIFKRVPDVDFSVLDNPIGSIFFNPDEKQFDYNVVDFDLKQKLEEMKKEIERKKAEKAAQEAAEREAALKKAAYTKDSLEKAQLSAKLKAQAEAEEAKKKAEAEAKAAEDAKKRALAEAEEAKRKAAADTAAAKEEEKRRAIAAEEAARLEAKKKAEQEAMEKEAAKKKAEQEELDRIEAKKKALQVEQDRIAEKKRQEIAEANRIAEEKRAEKQKELDRIAEKKRQEAEEANRIAEEKKAAQQEAAKAQEAKRQQAIEEEEKRVAQMKADYEARKAKEAKPAPSPVIRNEPPPVRHAPPVKPIESAPPEVIVPDNVRYDEFDYVTYHVRRTFVTVAGVETEYQKIIHQWGGVFYKRDGKDITDGTYKKEMRKYGLKPQ